jgi:OOP family OmpA-OmpF porin
LFDFDSATIRPAGKVELDKLASDLRPLHYDFITVTGHTDRIGSEKYNHDLSLRRAEAVKRYLVSSAGIMAARINTRGVDGSDPVTTASQCANLGKAALISCLQPDRRVEVEVVGTK